METFSTLIEYWFAAKIHVGFATVQLRMFWSEWIIINQILFPLTKFMAESNEFIGLIQAFVVFHRLARPSSHFWSSNFAYRSKESELKVDRQYDDRLPALTHPFDWVRSVVFFFRSSSSTSILPFVLVRPCSVCRHGGPNEPKLHTNIVMSSI